MGTAAQVIVHGGAPAGWLDLSVSLNPLGTPLAVTRAVEAARYGAYADLDTAAAEAHLAADAGVRTDDVLLTAGASEALRLLVATSVRPGDRVMIVGPTYGEYARLAAQAGATVDEVRAAAPDFEPPIGPVVERTARTTYRVVILCDPNNPTGAQLESARLTDLVTAIPSGSILIVDQSFLPFGSPTVSASSLIGSGRVALVRSLTKLLAAPGLRAGYVIAPPALMQRLRELRDPWAVGAHAIAAASVARWQLRAGELARIAEWRDRLAQGLRSARLEPLPSAANFLLARVPGGAAALARALAPQRIALRDCTSFGLPDHVRIAACAPPDQERLFAAIGAARAVTTA